MHPAQRIVEVIKAAVISGSTDAKVYSNRTTSLSEDQGECPAVLISMGADQPLAALSTMTALGSALTIRVSLVDCDADEEQLVKKLLQRRVLLHRLIAAIDWRSLGLSWVAEVGYLGADELNHSRSGEWFFKELPTRWQVAYQMDRLNPDVPD